MAGCPNQNRERPPRAGIAGWFREETSRTCATVSRCATTELVCDSLCRRGCSGNMIGLRLNNYEIVAQLGQGAMGTVWLALDPITRWQAAVKFLRPELMQDESAIWRFVNESRATNAIRHPNVVDIIDAGVLQCDGRTPYLMMEFLEGESLCQRLRRFRPLPVRVAVDIACQIASALTRSLTGSTTPASTWLRLPPPRASCSR